jgi:Electron transfer DM13
MRRRKNMLYVAGIVMLALAWYWFRPELLFVDRVVNEAFPAARTFESSSPQSHPMDESTVLARGEFHSVAHGTSGKAAIHRLNNGSRVLRLTDFETSNGPDVRVYLVAADDANDNAAVTAADVIELGPMKGNKGDQNYAVPADVALEHYRAVTIWCKRFSVNFGTAPLESTPS